MDNDYDLDDGDDDPFYDHVDGIENVNEKQMVEHVQDFEEDEIQLPD